MQVTDRPSPDAPSLTQAKIVQMETDVCAECAFLFMSNQARSHASQIAQSKQSRSKKKKKKSEKEKETKERNEAKEEKACPVREKR